MTELAALLGIILSQAIALDIPDIRVAYYVPLGRDYFSGILLVSGLIWLVLEISRPKSWLKSLARIVFPATLVFVAVVIMIFVQINIRRQSASPEKVVHDGVVQTEAALSFLSAGRNPYSADFRPTPFGRLTDVFSQGRVANPAWKHYVYPPGYLLVSLPFYDLFSALHVFYDQRLVHLLFFIIALALLLRLLPPAWQPLGLVMFALNPIFYWSFITGFNDIVVLAVLSAVFYCWHKQHFIWAFVMMGLALTIKQSALFYLPALCVALALVRPQLWKRCAAALIVPIAAVYGPFLVANARALFGDLVVYASSGGMGSYPISGSGLSAILLKAGLIQNMRDSYPFWILQIAVAAPLLWLVFYLVRSRPTAGIMIWSSTSLALGVWFVSRYFNNSHIVFLFQMVLLGWFFMIKETEGSPHAAG